MCFLKVEDVYFKTRGKNINSLHYADSFTLIAKNAKDLQSLQIKLTKHHEKKLEEEDWDMMFLTMQKSSACPKENYILLELAYSAKL